jgi:ankyrin repeat protein
MKLVKEKSILFFIFLLGFFASAQNKDIFEIARKGTLEEVQAIYNKNPELINTVNDNKYSPLILACYRGNVDVAQFLIKKVKNINYNAGMGTALMAAVMSGKLEIVNELILAKADLNQTSSDGKTALIFAAFSNKNEIVKALLKAKVDKTIKDKDGRTALDYANFNKNTELIIQLNQ